MKYSYLALAAASITMNVLLLMERPDSITLFAGGFCLTVFGAMAGATLIYWIMGDTVDEKQEEVEHYKDRFLSCSRANKELQDKLEVAQKNDYRDPKTKKFQRKSVLDLYE